MSQTQTLCSGELCRIRNNCKRYVPITNQTQAIYFMEAPWEIKKLQGISFVACEQQDKITCTN